MPAGNQAGALSGRSYTRTEPTDTVLHRVVHDGFDAFAEEFDSREDGRTLPGFVRRAFESFCACGDLAAGFARFRCSSCGSERLVAHTCKGRGFCPSCLGRRMVERSAHLVDRVLPAVPIRHWVLSLPFELRARLAWDHQLCRSVLGVFSKALLAHLTGAARAEGHANAHAGAVTVIQRAGSAANINVHFHTLAMDGAFFRDDDARLRFFRAGPPTANTLVDLTTRIHQGVLALLTRRGLISAESGLPEPKHDTEPPPMAELYAASAQERVATGSRAGKKTYRLRSAATAGDSAHSTGKRSARCGGFDLHATRAIPATHRDRLEKVCRYLLRPPISDSRLEYDGDLLLFKLPTPRKDGTTQLAFEPQEFVERLAALVVRPRANLIIYHGVLAANARLRPDVVRFGRPAESLPPPEKQLAPTRPNASWADLMRRGLGVDVLGCPKCSGRMKYIATILDPVVIRKILDHLEIRPEPHERRPRSRAPPSHQARAPTPSPLAARLARLRTKSA